MSLVIAMEPVCCVFWSVAFMVMVRMASFESRPLICFSAPVLRTFTSKLILTSLASGLGGGSTIRVFGLSLLHLLPGLLHLLPHLLERHHRVGMFQRIDDE